jgi:hypothetical protein
LLRRQLVAAWIADPEISKVSNTAMPADRTKATLQAKDSRIKPGSGRADISQNQPSAKS